MTNVDSATTVVVKRDPEEPDCEVCSVDGSTPDCSPTEKTLTNVANLTLEFSCLNPQNVYNVMIKKHIGESISNALKAGRCLSVISGLLYISDLCCGLQKAITMPYFLRVHQDPLHSRCSRSPS